MVNKLLTQKYLAKIDRANIVSFILKGVREIEIGLVLNELPRKRGFSSETKIKVHNLISLLSILSEECKHEPNTGQLLLEAESLINFLEKLMQNDLLPLLGRKSPSEINSRVKKIIAHLETWRTDLLHKIMIKPGNSHTSSCYHPEFPLTYSYKPMNLPDDYRSNFFFEASVKELCPFTTLIGFHPYSEIQSSFQDNRPIHELTYVDINVDLRDDIAIEKTDNIRALRLHGPKENKNLPGSYIMVKGGHHRLRALYQKFLQGAVDRDLKILIQLVEPSKFPLSQGDFFSLVEKEIVKRHDLRKKF